VIVKRGGAKNISLLCTNQIITFIEMLQNMVDADLHFNKCLYWIVHQICYIWMTDHTHVLQLVVKLFHKDEIHVTLHCPLKIQFNEERTIDNNFDNLFKVGKMHTVFVNPCMTKFTAKACFNILKHRRFLVYCK
jgi:hypothetical protein